MFKEDFEKMLKKLSPTIRRISHRLNGHFTFFNDDDLCQEALMHLWVLFQKGKISDKTDSYILQGCYYHLKNYIRTSMDKAKLTSLEKPIDDEGTMLEEMIAPARDSNFEGLEGNMLWTAVIQNGLSDRERKILEYLLEGLTVREVGQKMGISHVSVIKIRNKIRSKCLPLKKEVNGGYQN